MTGSITLVTDVPGPNSRALAARRQAATAAGVADLSGVAVARASGAVVTDVDGNELLDFAGGIGVLALGHCPPAVVAAMRDQAEDLLHICTIVGSYEPFIAVSERLNEITPGDFPKKTLLMNSGAEAVESAVKFARAATGRQAVLVFEGAYHGRTNLTMAMTSKYAPFKKGFGPFAPEVYRIPFPDVYRRPGGMSEHAFVDWSVDRLRTALVAHIDPAELAAVVIEPVQGEGGFVPAPARFLQAIREVCDEHGIVLVADEIQSGFGRTGRLLAIEHSGVVPDLVTTAKSLGSGMPIAAVTGRAGIVDSVAPGGMGGTYSGNPLACVAALATIAQVNTPEFLGRAGAIGERMRDALEALRRRHPERISDVRGLGSMLAIELVHDPVSRQPDSDATLAVTRAAVARGLVVIRAGLFSNCVRFLPPLTVTDDQVDEAMTVLADAVDEVAAAGWVRRATVTV